MKTALRSMIILLLCCLPLTGIVAADDDLRAVSIQLQWLPQTQFAGYYAAQALGYYADENLHVDILNSRGDILPTEAVMNGEADFGVGWLPALLMANQASADLVSIAQIFQRSGMLQVSLAESGIETLDDFVHKRHGYWTNDNSYDLLAALWRHGYDVYHGEHLTLTEQAYNLDALLAGELDTAQTLVYNNYGLLLGQVNPATGERYREDEFNIIDFNDIGTAMLQDQIFARADWLAQPGSQTIALALLKASLRGWIHCRDHPDDCLRIVRDIDPALDETHQRWQMNEVNKLIWTQPRPIGLMRADRWQATVDNMQLIHALQDAPPKTSYRSDLALLALDALQLDGLEVTGAGWQPAIVALSAEGA